MTELAIEAKAHSVLMCHFSLSMWIREDLRPLHLINHEGVAMGAYNHHSGNAAMLFFVDCVDVLLTDEELTVMYASVKDYVTEHGLIYELYIIEFLDHDGNEFRMTSRIIHPA